MSNKENKPTGSSYNGSPPASKAVAAENSVAPKNFYGSDKHTPHLPPRPPGSSNTHYRPPSPPSYRTVTPFREPELVSEEPMHDDDNIPELLPADATTQQQSQWYQGPTHWSNASASNYTTGVSADGWGPSNYTDNDWAGGTVSNNWGNSYGSRVRIENSVDREETRWWDAKIRSESQRPGPGLMPPAIEDLLHDPEHSLFNVKATQPIVAAAPSESTSAKSDEGSSSRLSNSVSPRPSTPSQHQSLPPPSDEDLIQVIPHPNAYYCRRHNGWVILQWKSGSLPPLAKDYECSHPLPDPSSRSKVPCGFDNTDTWARSSKTHHYHLYPKAVDDEDIIPPFHRQEWETLTEARKWLKEDNTSTDAPMAVDEEASANELAKEEYEADLLDIYICCQCMTHCVVSGIIPGVIPLPLVEEFTRFRFDSPSVGRNGNVSVVQGWETFLTILENTLWKDDHRTLRVGGAVFSKKLGWNDNIDKIFRALGFCYTDVPESGSLIYPPPTQATDEGRRNRAKLLRAWVEISVWLTDYMKRSAPGLKDYVPKLRSVNILNAREEYQTGIGAHVDQISRDGLPQPLIKYEPLEQTWKVLGMTPTSYSPEMLVFSYLAQCRCDPENTPLYFTKFYGVFEAMQGLGLEVPHEIQSTVMDERNRGRYTLEEQHKYITILGFGPEGSLQMDLEDDVDDDFIINAWRDKVFRSWRDPKNGGQLQRDANDALRVVAETRGSSRLYRMWDENQGRTMNPDSAYSTLEIPADVDEDMLLTVFSLRVEEHPSRGEKMREALTIIAELRESERLRQFLKTGADPGEIVVPIRFDLPRGLNQLGNTCYLNSLLQYFYTIKDLREAVAPLAGSIEKPLEDNKLSDDALKLHRVGGRLVTRREVTRSKKFVSQLATLFTQMELYQTAAVTPTIELAKLALVTSRDEEEDEVDRGGTDSSNDTDATLVEEAPTRLNTLERSPLRSPNSVLGKRLRPQSRQKSSMDIDIDQTKDDYVMVSSPTSPLLSKATTPPDQAGSSRLGNTIEVIDVDMEDDVPVKAAAVTEKPNPPPRKEVVNDDSVMMFGKQHDVSECMDNCMFQIETALLKFDGLTGSGDDKGSIVKRLFYGKIRQRLAAVSEDRKSRASIHEKEDLFSHLPVNVAEDGFDLYDGLSGYFDDIVDFEGKKARMEVSLVDLPPLLQVQLQRVQFNRETLQPYKSQAYVKFGETIYMDRFLDGADPPKKARSKSIQSKLNACRERLNVLNHGKHAPFTVALENTLNFLSKHDGLASPAIDDDLVSQLNEEQRIVKAEIEQLRGQVIVLKEELESLWSSEKETPYELTSVFVHRGSSPSWGHYFFYSRNLPDQPDSWFKYNDSDVTEVSKDEVLADTSGLTANPYLLVYARKGSEVIQTVKRFDPDSVMETSQ